MEQLHGDKPNVPFNIKHINIKPKLIIHKCSYHTHNLNLNYDKLWVPINLIAKISNGE